MKEFVKNTTMFVAVSAASAGVAVAIVADMSKRKGRPPDRYSVGTPGIMPIWDEKNPVDTKNSGGAFGTGPGYFYGSFSGGVQGKSYSGEKGQESHAEVKSPSARHT